MKDLAPNITRQRLLIEGVFSIDVDQATIVGYLEGLAGHLSLRTYGAATVHATGAAGKTDNQGYDAFIPLIDSGISLYLWSNHRFFAVLLFTCKAFSNADAIAYTQEYFGATAIEHQAF